MKKIISILFLLMVFVAVKQANASMYSIDDQSIDKLFATATETSMISVNAFEMGALPSNIPTMAMAQEKDAIIAIVLDFFVGGLGIHRLYLGTETLTWVGYILTCGGIFGVVPLIDFVVLIINNDDISQYIDNPKFFMWQ